METQFTNLPKTPVVWNIRKRIMSAVKTAMANRQVIFIFSEIILDCSVKKIPGIKNKIRAIKKVVLAITCEAIPCFIEIPCLSFKSWAFMGSPPRVPKGVMEL